MNSNMNKILEAASRKLGVSVEELQKSLNSGNPDEMLKNMNSTDRSKLNSILADKKTAEKLAKNPLAAEIIKKMNK